MNVRKNHDEAEAGFRVSRGVAAWWLWATKMAKQKIGGKATMLLVR